MLVSSSCCMNDPVQACPHSHAVQVVLVHHSFPAVIHLHASICLFAHVNAVIIYTILLFMLVFIFSMSQIENCQRTSHLSTCPGGHLPHCSASFFHSPFTSFVRPLVNFWILSPPSSIFSFFHPLLLQDAVPPCVPPLPSILPFVSALAGRLLEERLRSVLEGRGEGCSL